jgi:hypothetical protein
MRELAAISSYTWALLAEAELPDLGGFPTGILTAATTGSILGWYLWYNVTRVLPEKDRQSQEAIMKLATDFRDEMRLERESHRAEVDGLRDQMRAEDKR